MNRNKGRGRVAAALEVLSVDHKELKSFRWPSLLRDISRDAAEFLKREARKKKAKR